MARKYSPTFKQLFECQSEYIQGSVIITIILFFKFKFHLTTGYLRNASHSQCSVFDSDSLFSLISFPRLRSIEQNGEMIT